MLVPDGADADIVGADFITEGKSYYLAEVLAALDVSRPSTRMASTSCWSTSPSGGTNTEVNRRRREGLPRGAGATRRAHPRGVTRQGAREAAVETFRPMHFTERIEDQDIVFDYTLREGACPTRNAIRILISPASRPSSWRKRAGSRSRSRRAHADILPTVELRVAASA